MWADNGWNVLLWLITLDLEQGTSTAQFGDLMELSIPGYNRKWLKSSWHPSQGYRNACDWNNNECLVHLDVMRDEVFLRKVSAKDGHLWSAVQWRRQYTHSYVILETSCCQERSLLRVKARSFTFSVCIRVMPMNPINELEVGMVSCAFLRFGMV